MKIQLTPTVLLAIFSTLAVVAAFSVSVWSSSLVGTTWVDNYGETYVFKTGTVVERQNEDSNVSWKYTVEGNVVTMHTFFGGYSLERNGDEMVSGAERDKPWVLKRKRD